MAPLRSRGTGIFYQGHSSHEQVPPLRRGEGRSMLRPSGLARIYPGAEAQ